MKKYFYKQSKDFKIEKSERLEDFDDIMESDISLSIALENVNLIGLSYGKNFFEISQENDEYLIRAFVDGVEDFRACKKFSELKELIFEAKELLMESENQSLKKEKITFPKWPVYLVLATACIVLVILKKNAYIMIPIILGYLVYCIDCTVKKQMYVRFNGKVTYKDNPNTYVFYLVINWIICAFLIGLIVFLFVKKIFY